MTPPLSSVEQSHSNPSIFASVARSFRDLEGVSAALPGLSNQQLVDRRNGRKIFLTPETKYCTGRLLYCRLCLLAAARVQLGLTTFVQLQSIDTTLTGLKNLR
jgi:hypothetical protein